LIRNISIVALIGLLIGCQTSYGDKYQKGKLEVFYDKGTKSFAKPLAEYFSENGLIGDIPQSLQISSTDMSAGESEQYFILKMIQIDNNKDFNSEEMKEIKNLEKDLEEKVFFGELKIVLCNANFLENP
jgi:hypothetical protein